MDYSENLTHCQERVRENLLTSMVSRTMMKKLDNAG